MLRDVREQKVREHLAKARESCLAAVASYNNPTTRFRTGSYIVLMINCMDISLPRYRVQTG